MVEANTGSCLIGGGGGVRGQGVSVGQVSVYIEYVLGEAWDYYELARAHTQCLDFTHACTHMHHMHRYCLLSWSNASSKFENKKSVQLKAFPPQCFYSSMSRDARRCNSALCGAVISTLRIRIRQPHQRELHRLWPWQQRLGRHIPLLLRKLVDSVPIMLNHLGARPQQLRDGFLLDHACFRDAGLWAESSFCKL